MTEFIFGRWLLPMFIRNERSIKEFMRFYPIVSTLVILNVVIWLLYFLHTSIGLTIYQYGIGQNYAVSLGDYWRLVTPIFLHSGSGISHVGFNSFSLVLFGPALEQMLGKTKFIIAYFGTGIFANIATYIIDPTSTTLHLGASGAIYGLFGIYIFMVLFRQHLIDPGNAQIIVVIFVIGLVMTFIQPNINIAAHVFGAIGGFAIAALILQNVEPFSMVKNHMKVRTRKKSNPDDIQFDPNRWDKKRNFSNNRRKNIIWIIFGILVVIGLFARFF